ncbi:MAG: hypothetical protein JJU15_10735 [Pararhodobacter sp.]|nr:hypothetical protein [Pararhodobacter sp.]
MTDKKSEDQGAASAEEQRALDADELQLADMARHPALGQHSNRTLSDLVSRLRTRRNRARDISNRQGREARAKAPPAGSKPAMGNTGTLTKLDYLSAALERAVNERQSRGGSEGADTAQPDASQPRQTELAQKAMDLKTAGDQGPNAMTEDGGPLHPHDPDASQGKGALDGSARRTAPSGALDHAGDLPSRERSRTRY